MALTGIALVDTDLSTVLFDLHSADGASNSAWGSVVTKFGLGGSLTTTAPLDAERFEKLGSDGGFTTFARRALGTAAWRQGIAGSSEANLRLGVGRLTDLLTSGTILRVVAGSTRYLRIEPSGYPTPFQGKELELWDIYQALSFLQGLDILAACQPYWEGAEITTSGVTVPNDPATGTKVRTYPVTVSGDLPTPGRVRVQMDTGATVQHILIANRARKFEPSSFFADYLSNTGFFQCESTNRTWTITLGTNTTSVADANASGGNMARCTHVTDPSIYNRRIRATRTANLDSLRGAWDVWIRVKANGNRDYRLQLKWGPSTADPPAFTNAEVSHDTLTSPAPAFGYVELNLGRIYFPPDVPMGGLALEIWTRLAAGGSTSNLDMDLIWLVPAASQGTVVVSGKGGAVSQAAPELITPVANPAGGTAATLHSSGLFLSVDTTTDNVGTAPNTGVALSVGRWRATFSIFGATGWAVDLIARNITDSNNAASRTVILPTGNAIHALEFDAVAGKLYQFQVDNPSSIPMRVYSISWEFIPALGINESARTDPRRSVVDRLDSSGNLSGYLGIEGGVPVLLEPGDNHLMIRCDEVPLVLYNEPENKLARTPTVTVAYFPRYPF